MVFITGQTKLQILVIAMLLVFKSFEVNAQNQNTWSSKAGLPTSHPLLDAKTETIAQSRGGHTPNVNQQLKDSAFHQLIVFPLNKDHSSLNHIKNHTSSVSNKEISHLSQAGNLPVSKKEIDRMLKIAASLGDHFANFVSDPSSIARHVTTTTQSSMPPAETKEIISRTTLQEFLQKQITNNTKASPDAPSPHVTYRTMNEVPAKTDRGAVTQEMFHQTERLVMNNGVTPNPVSSQSINMPISQHIWPQHVQENMNIENVNSLTNIARNAIPNIAAGAENMNSNIQTPFSRKPEVRALRGGDNFIIGQHSRNTNSLNRNKARSRPARLLRPTTQNQRSFTPLLIIPFAQRSIRPTKTLSSIRSRVNGQTSRTLSTIFNTKPSLTFKRPMSSSSFPKRKMLTARSRASLLRQLQNNQPTVKRRMTFPGNKKYRPKIYIKPWSHKSYLPGHLFINSIPVIRNPSKSRKYKPVTKIRVLPKMYATYWLNKYKADRTRRRQSVFNPFGRVEDVRGGYRKYMPFYQKKYRPLSYSGFYPASL